MDSSMPYKDNETNSNDKFIQSLNRRFNSEMDLQKMRKCFSQFMDINNTYESDILAQSISYFISRLKTDPLEFSDPFVDRLMKLLFMNNLNSEIRDLALRLVSKMLKYDTGVIENLLNNGLEKLIISDYPSKYSLKFCTKLSTFRRDYQMSFLKNGTLFYCNEDFNEKIMNYEQLKLYANFFSSLVKNIYEDLPTIYFDFCHYLVKNLVNDEVTESKARCSIIKALLTLIQASNNYEDEMIKRNVFFEIIKNYKTDDELKDKSDDEIEKIKETNLFMQDASKLELCNMIEILIILTKNYSEYLIANGFFDWIFCFYHQNSEFHQNDKKKLMCIYLTFLGDLAFYNQNIFQHPLYLDHIFEIVDQFDEYHFKIKTSILRLIYILFDRSTFEARFQLMNRDIYLILLSHISFTDFSDRLMVLNTIMQIFRCCPEDKIFDLYQSAKGDEDFISFLTGPQPENDDSQSIAELILNEIHKFDDEEDNE